MPGFVDTHIHAPQYVYTGTGYDVPLLQWLEKYTFPVESKFKCTKFAEYAYRKVVVSWVRLSRSHKVSTEFAIVHTPRLYIIKLFEVTNPLFLTDNIR